MEIITVTRENASELFLELHNFFKLTSSNEEVDLRIIIKPFTSKELKSKRERDEEIRAVAKKLRRAAADHRNEFYPRKEQYLQGPPE